MILEIIFVCTGNTCRSPMAEAYIKKVTGESSFQSAGITAIEGLPASENSIRILESIQIDLNNHRSQRINKDNLEKADLILTMTLSHKQRILQVFPHLHNKTYTLKEYIHNVDVYGIVTKISEIEAIIIAKKAEISSDKPLKEQEILIKEVERKIEELNELYDILDSLDISDPFGGDIDVYQSSFEEIKEYIDILIKRLET